MEWVFLIMNKKELRKKYLNLRSKLSLNESQKAQLSQNLLAVAAKARCNRLFLYKAFKNEINVEDLLVDELLNMDLYLPNISHADEIIFIRAHGQTCIQNKYGILELPYRSVDVGHPDVNTLIVTPCAAFDLLGYRLGYGGGYYDRYMAKYPDAVYVAVAYDEQESDPLPVEKFDMKVNYLVTASRILEC